MRLQVTPIGDLVEPVKTWNPKSRPEVLFPYIDLSAVDQVEKKITGANLVGGKDAPSRARQLVRCGDVLVSTVRPNLNGIAPVTKDFDGATASTGFCVLRPKLNKLDARYLMNWVRSPAFVKNMVREATGASYPAVSDRIVKASHIPLPSLGEQQRIAAILDKADALRRKRKRALDLLDGFSQSLFLEIFGDPLRNPKGIPVFEFDEILAEPPNFGTMIPPVSERRGWVSLRVANIQNWRLTLEDTKYVDLPQDAVTKHSLEDGDIVLARAIASEEHLGKCVVVRPGGLKWAFDSHLMRIRLNKQRADPVFIREMFKTAGGRQIFLRCTRKTTVQYNINTKELREMRVPIPSRNMQMDFLLRFEAMQAPRTRTEAHMSDANLLFASLQHRAFSGQL